MATSATGMAANHQPKGILKKRTTPSATTTEPPFPSSSPSASSPPASTTTTPLTRPERLAQQEAAARLALLKKLRDTELKPPVPLETFELLSQQLPTPTDPPTPASSPSARDVSLLLSHLRDFQPSEYLDLIEERNCLGRCGYALCPRPRRAHEGPFTITTTSSSSGGGSIARSADLNKWCSDACARRALYLKVQLDNPSYERDAGTGRMVVRLELREEPGRSGGGGGVVPTTTAAAAAATATATRGGGAVRGSEEDRTTLAQAMAQLEIDKQKQEKQKGGAAALAGERGDPGGVFTGVSRVEVTIKESAADGPVRAPSQADGDAFLRVEGYKPSFGTGKKPDEGAESAESDDDDDDFFAVRF